MASVAYDTIYDPEAFSLILKEKEIMSLTRLQILICVDVTPLSLEVMVIYCYGSVLLRTWHYDDK